MILRRMTRAAFLVLPCMLAILWIYTSISSRWLCLRVGSPSAVSLEVSTGCLYAAYFNVGPHERVFQTQLLDPKTLSAIRDVWQKHPHFLGFGCMRAGPAGGYLRIPMWFLLIASVLLARLLWRWTIPIYVGNAFPIEKEKTSLVSPNTTGTSGIDA
jgi:hypothetical protein